MVKKPSHATVPLNRPVKVKSICNIALPVFYFLSEKILFFVFASTVEFNGPSEISFSFFY
jgi:hypothetical protein